VAFPQQDQLPVSDKYPLRAHMVSVEIEQQQHLTNGSGEISTRRLMTTEIADKTYLLVVSAPPVQERSFQHRTWLSTGFYPARRTKHGFDLEYRDGDKVRHEELRIMSDD
jgi:hypothetical protein